jgi:PPK2 family polyphosphate:nucleotide phosphotransferase
MFNAVSHPYLVPADHSFRYDQASTQPPKSAPSKKLCEKRLQGFIKNLDEVQRRLYAHDKYALLLIFQAMDTAGKDGTIRAVMRGVNPAGCQVFSFKQPSHLELDHDFLWRTTCRLPERGRIGIFNRSYYEEVLVVRVHPEYLKTQKLPIPISPTIWDERYESIRNHELHLAHNGTIILKFWLHVSKEEQRRRLLARLTEPEKHWKFSQQDLQERKLWKRYMAAYGAAVNATSRSWAPWYVIPADDKPFMRMCVAEIITRTLECLHLQYPAVSRAKRQTFAKFRKQLQR